MGKKMQVAQMLMTYSERAGSADKLISLMWNTNGSCPDRANILCSPGAKVAWKHYFIAIIQYLLGVHHPKGIE